MFIPVFHSLIFYKACLEFSTDESPLNCSSERSSAAKDPRVHTRANTVILLASSGLCLTGMFTSYVVGKIGDKFSRKLGLLIPFAGLIIADLTLIFQAHYVEISPMFFVVSEVIFGLFGGYMSIFSSAFAIVSSQHTNAQKRAKNIARMEGLLAFGGMTGFLISSQLTRVSYVPMSSFFLLVHFCAFLVILGLPSKTFKETFTRPSLLETPAALHKRLFIPNLIILYAAFAVSYFAFIGKTRILFFYLKERLFWDAAQFSYLRASIMACSTFMAFVVYPWLKSKNLPDVTLAIFGLTSRCLGIGWYAVAWSDYSVFFVIFFEMFAKFPATGLRSLIASNADAADRGVAFAVLAAIEAAGNLLSSLCFHTLFPLTVGIFPQLSFVLMAVIILPAILVVFAKRRQLESKNVPAEESKEAHECESSPAGLRQFVPKRRATILSNEPLISRKEESSPSQRIQPGVTRKQLKKIRPLLLVPGSSLSMSTKSLRKPN
ncbi:unnamed protein product [Caenorhabditis auriculariae]|uniref:Major facilitator superfamily (MFS) profile domain-containing protein n=1 Tax=Caenorhabditis auriculariae TaxID=2777116 RepID=A0A8S1HAF9_9PELO|nr:unnamed protein product [Caenorhabditis auriculariae]